MKKQSKEQGAMAHYLPSVHYDRIEKSADGKICYFAEISHNGGTNGLLLSKKGVDNGKIKVRNPINKDD